MKKKTKPGVPTCTSTLSGGAIVCLVEGEHTEHCSSTTKKGQYAKWSLTGDGRVHVQPFLNGKKQGDGWFDPAPPQPTAMATSGNGVQGDPAPRGAASEAGSTVGMKQTAGRHLSSDKEPDLYSADKCKKCGEEMGAHDGKKCPKPEKKAKPCGETMAGITCTLPAGHHGDHAGDGGEWSRDRKNARFDCAPDRDEREDDATDPNIIELEDGTLYDRRSPIGPPVKLPESWSKKPAKAKPAKASQVEPVAPHVCANAARDPSTGKPLKGAHAKACEREFGHDGPHRIGPHGDLEHVVEWEDSNPGWVAYNRKAQPPLTLDDEPEDPEADEAALAAMDAQERDALDDEPDSAARWHCEEPFVGSDGREYKCEGRNEHNGAHYAWSVVHGKTVYAATAPDVVPRPQDDDGDDPYEDEVRSDADRELARQQREEREKHERELEALRENTRAAASDFTGRKPKPRRSQYDKPGPLTPQQVDKLPPAARDNLRILGYRRHPAAALFPLLEGEAFDRFADRVQASGLRDAIVLVAIDGEEWILDGSNRALACEQRGVAAHFKHYEGPTDMASLVAYSIDKNGDGRRHLEPSVRAMIADEAATLGRGNPGKRETGGTAGLSQAEAGKRLNVGERLVRKARVVREKGTAKVKQAVMAGKLTVEAAEVVTKLPPTKQDAIADEALARKSGEIKAGRVRALVKQEEKRATVRKINEQRVSPMPTGAFGVIYADYPWLYENSDQHEGSRGHLPYPPMPMDEILAHAREAAKRAGKHCVLALWVTNLHVVNGNAARVVEAFGATAHSMFTWPKPRFVIGTWGRGQTEHLVIASIGKPTHTLNEVSTLLPSWKPAHPDEHSSKPAEVAELLQEHCGGPFLELFAREDREGWACWGAEVDKFATEAA